MLAKGVKASNFIHGVKAMEKTRQRIWIDLAQNSFRHEDQLEI